MPLSLLFHKNCLPTVPQSYNFGLYLHCIVICLLTTIPTSHLLTLPIFLFYFQEPIKTCLTGTRITRSTKLNARKQKIKPHFYIQAVLDAIRKLAAKGRENEFYVEDTQKFLVFYRKKDFVSPQNYMF